MSKTQQQMGDGHIVKLNKATGKVGILARENYIHMKVETETDAEPRFLDHKNRPVYGFIEKAREQRIRELVTGVLNPNFEQRLNAVIADAGHYEDADPADLAKIFGKLYKEFTDMSLELNPAVKESVN